MFQPLNSFNVYTCIYLDLFPLYPCVYILFLSSVSLLLCLFFLLFSCVYLLYHAVWFPLFLCIYFIFSMYPCNSCIMLLSFLSILVSFCFSFLSIFVSIFFPPVILLIVFFHSPTETSQILPLSYSWRNIYVPTSIINVSTSFCPPFTKLSIPIA